MKSDNNNLDKILSSNINNLNNLGNVQSSHEDILSKLNNPSEFEKHSSFKNKELETIKENIQESETEEFHAPSRSIVNPTFFTGDRNKSYNILYK